MTEIFPGRGTAIIKFAREQEASSFKRKTLSYEIRGRPIKIHFSNSVVRRNRSHSRGKSVSRAVVRTRTKSECGDSLESPVSDTVEDPRVVKSEPRVVMDLSHSMQGLATTSRPGQFSGSSGGEETGGEGGAVGGGGSTRPRRMHAKMKSKLKLKNRKKSEATPGFRNKQTETEGDEEDYETDDSDQFSQQMRTNITSLIDHHQVCQHQKITSPTLYPICFIIVAAATEAPQSFLLGEISVRFGVTGPQSRQAGQAHLPSVS